MRQILTSAMIIAALGALVVNSTFALFTDQEIIAGNTVATGELALTLNHTAGKPYDIQNAYPGFQDGWEYMDIFNSGLMPFEAYVSFEKTGGSTDLYNALKMEMEEAGGDSVCNTNDFGENPIYNGFVKDFAPQTLVSHLWQHANEEDASGSPADNIRAGWTMRVCQKLSIDSEAGNEIMGESVTFSEIVDAMQDND